MITEPMVVIIRENLLAKENKPFETVPNLFTINIRPNPAISHVEIKFTTNGAAYLISFFVSVTSKYCTDTYFNILSFISIKINIKICPVNSAMNNPATPVPKIQTKIMTHIKLISEDNIPDKTYN